MKCSIYRKLTTLALMTGLVLISACASNPSTEKSATVKKTSDIEQRASERWSKLLAGDLAGAYEYLSPGFRSSVGSLDYQRAILAKKVRWTDAQYRSSECDEMTCEVKILLKFKVAGALPGVRSYDGQQDIKEKWVKSDGVWYLVP